MDEQHMATDVLEQYAIGNLSAESLPHIEEHLLSCSTCQAKLVDIDEFVRLFRLASTPLEMESPSLWKRIWHLQPARWATAAALLALSPVFLQIPRRAAATETVIAMQSTRGLEMDAHLPADKPAVLLFDLPSPAPAAYRMRILNTTGANVLEADTSLRGGRPAASIRHLARGDYWVRLYRADNNQLQAEYSLRSR